MTNIINKRNCMSCGNSHYKYDLYWINDNYCIPYKRVCENCYEHTRNEIRSNNYGDELSYEEIYGDGESLVDDELY